MSVKLFLLLLISSVAATEDRSRTFMQQLPELDRELMLTNFMFASKKPCSAVTKAELVHIDSRDREIWSVYCANSLTYLLVISNETGGRTEIMDCDKACLAQLKAKE